jgi:excinuclease UvrABC nuclease subunit
MNELLRALLAMRMQQNFVDYYKSLTSSSQTPKDGSSTMISYIGSMFAEDIERLFTEQNSKPTLQIDLDIERKEESLALAVQKEEFENAAKYRDELVVLKENRTKIEELQKKKEDAVKNEDFETAKELKLEIENITNPTSADS